MDISVRKSQKLSRDKQEIWLPVIGGQSFSTYGKVGSGIFKCSHRGCNVKIRAKINGNQISDVSFISQCQHNHSTTTSSTSVTHYECKQKVHEAITINPLMSTRNISKFVGNYRSKEALKKMIQRERNRLIDSLFSNLSSSETQLFLNDVDNGYVIYASKEKLRLLKGMPFTFLFMNGS